MNLTIMPISNAISAPQKSQSYNTRKSNVSFGMSYSQLEDIMARVRKLYPEMNEEKVRELVEMTLRSVQNDSGIIQAFKIDAYHASKK